jgi:streptogramin lyase
MTYSGEIQYAMGSGAIGAMTSGFVVANGGSYDPGVCATVGTNSGCFDVLNPGTPNHSDATSTGFGWNGNAAANTLAIGADHLLYMGESGRIEARALNCTFSAGIGSCLDPLYSYTASGNITALTVGHDGTIWFVEQGSANGDLIGHIQPGNGAAGVLNEYGTQIFGSSAPSATALPYGLTLGADNNLWFTDGANSTVDQVTP